MINYVIVHCKCNKCNIEKEYERTVSEDDIKVIKSSESDYLYLVIDDYIHTCPIDDEEGYYSVYKLIGPLER